jgi:hypothetical protein
MEEMGGVVSHLSWFAIVSVVVAYATSAVLGSIVNAQASGANAPIIIRDELSANEHTLSGMVMVPTPCDELSVQTETLSKTTIALLFTTWHEPSVTCGDDATPRAFQTALFAPAAGVTFTATLDDKDLPIAVVPIIQNSR